MNNYKILKNTEQSKVLRELEIKFLFTNWGRIDWNRINNKKQLSNALDIKSELLEDSILIYIIWDEVTLPIIKSDLLTVIKLVDDITAVSFDTWLFSPDDGVVVEFYHDGEITIGFYQ